MGVNVQASVEVQVLGANLTGMVSKTTEGEQTTTEFLIMPSAIDENEPITVDVVVQEINNMINMIENNTSEPEDGNSSAVVNEESIRDAMKVVGLEDMSLTFMQTFIHYKKVVEKAGQADPEKEISKLTEYAIGIHIKGKKAESQEFKFLDIKEAYINVWNTSNQKILERMKIWTPKQLE